LLELAGKQDPVEEFVREIGFALTVGGKPFFEHGPFQAADGSSSGMQVSVTR
jgi:hypothetical protein